ncbi:NLRC5 [Branchiostoma lanceolatum]|uniref:NLRC5 protein n=1 Tax=Branchiostoma lanceolatum TaxID=7740 RepID=A0A8K0EWS9_BRALA|nr:NLRC5 [Branchiostoma lanceolatum]
MAELSHRARLYKKIDDDLSENDVRSLRAMLVADGHLGQARVENTTPLEMFNMLEADNKIGKGNLALLVDLLKSLGKTKLAQEAEDVAKREGTRKPACTVEDVITCLKDLYASEHARVRPLPWCEDLNLSLEEVYTNLQHQCKDDKGRFEDTDTIVSLGDIYKTNKARAKNADAGTDVRRIRVEGDPGIGKSCSCQKLAHDWSSGKLGVFNAVFFLEIRHMSGKVKDAIFEQLLPEDTNMTPDQLWSYIQDNQDDVLFILDGLDELSQTAREVTDVVALIQGKILRNCHVLVTSRPYHCVKDLEKCHELYTKINDNLSEDDVRSLRAMLVSDMHLGQAKVENATPSEMFNMLEADNKIWKGNLALLVDLLKALGKTKLAEEAKDVAKGEDTGGPSCADEDVITCLKDLYATEYAKVRPLPWCEDLNLPLGEFYTNLQYQRRDGRGHLVDTGTIVSLESIYKTRKAKAKNINAGPTIRRIRVEGDPGIGKSCSCQKLAHDWSSGKLDIFKAVFFLEIRHMSGKVKDAIFEQLLPEDTNMTPDQLWSYIQENQDDVLFILDGLDELNQTARESTDVVALIQGKILRNCHVLVTSRPGQMS